MLLHSRASYSLLSSAATRFEAGSRVLLKGTDYPELEERKVLTT
jgi:hypothetical protein